MRYRSGTCTLLYRHVPLVSLHTHTQTHALCSTKKHGISMNTFYARVRGAAATVLVVEDWNHWTFGAFISEPWKTAATSFYGTGARPMCAERIS